MPEEDASQYRLMELRKKDLDPDPFVQFRHWYNDALESDIKYPHAVTLSTASVNGVPSSRVVLLKGIDERGFRFYTNSLSRKGQELGDNPNASLCFWWEELERQVRINGSVEKLPVSVSEEYFKSRPRGSQLGAWASSQSGVIENRDVLDRKYEEYEKKFKENNIPRPEYWNGYRVIPVEFEFWQGRPNRLHDRLRYRYNQSGSWQIERLQP